MQDVYHQEVFYDNLVRGCGVDKRKDRVFRVVVWEFRGLRVQAFVVFFGEH